MFELTIKLGNAMQTPYDVSDALKNVAEELHDGYTSGNVCDVNGNNVGAWVLKA